MTRAELIEKVAKIIAGPDQHGGQDDETWREWVKEAEQIDDVYAEKTAALEGLLTKYTGETWREELDDLIRPEETGAPADDGQLHVHCARCGTWTAAVRSRSLANNEMDVCPACEVAIEAEVANA